jgi:phage terminase small subunit
MSGTRNLTPRQQAFVEYYAASGNAGDAARKAGYNPRYARENAPKLLQNTKIQEELAALVKSKQSARIASVEERQQFWTSILRGEENYEAEMKDRLKASELLGKCQGDFIERVQNSGYQEIIVRYVQD